MTIELCSGLHVFTGTASWRDGRPFVGHVSAFREDWQNRTPHGGRALATGPDGSFTLDGLDDDVYELEFVVAGRFRSRRLDIHVPHDRNLTIVVDAEREPLRGCLLAEQTGMAIAGAEVLLERTASFVPTRVMDRSVTARDGTFTLLRFPIQFSGEEARVVVRAEGYAPKEFPLPAGMEEIEIRLSPPVAINGCVRSAGEARPLPGVPVRAFSLGEATVKRATATAEDGTYRLDGLPAGPAVVYAHGKGWTTRGLSAARSGGYNPFVIDLPADGPAKRDLVAVPASRLEGCVENETGRGVESALVEVEVDDPAWWFPTPDSVVTGPDGRFAVGDVVPGIPYRLATRPRGYLRVATGIAHAPSGTTSGILLSLSAPRRGRIRVVEEGSGSPIPGAGVYLSEESGFGDTVARVPGGTDSHGWCTVGPLPSGRLVVNAWHDDYRALTRNVDLVENEDGSLTATLEMVPDPAVEGVVSGHVLMVDGRPARRGRVELESVGEEPDYRKWTGVGATGTFHFDNVPPGEFELRVRTSIWGLPEQTATVRCKAGDEPVVVQLTAVGGGNQTEHGVLRILDSDGSPVAQGQVRLRYQTPDQKWSDTAVLLSGECRYEIGEGSVIVEVCQVCRRDGTPLAAARLGPLVRTRPEIEVRLEREVTIEGRVTDGAGAPIAGVRIDAVPVRDSSFGVMSRAHSSAWTGSDGRYVLRGLGAMAYRLRVATGESWSTVHARRVDPGAEPEVVVLHPATSTILTVLDAAGRPVEGAEVEFGLEEFLRDGSGVTDTSGRVRLPGLSPRGRYLLVVKAPAAREDLRPFRLECEDWTPATTTIRFAAAWSLTGRAVDLTGAPLRTAFLWRRGEDGEWVSAGQTEGDGEFVITELPDGPSELRAGALRAPGRGARAHAVVSQGAAEIHLRIDTAPEIRGRVLDWPRDMYGHATLTRADDAKADCAVRVTGDGTFRFACLDPKASYHLHVTSTVKGRTVYLRNLRPGRDEVRATLTTARPVTVRLIFPKDFRPHSHLSVKLTGPGLWDYAERAEDGRYRFESVPEGTWTLEVMALGSDGVLEATRTVKAGDDVEIAFTEEDLK